MNPLEKLALFDPGLAGAVAERAAGLSVEALEGLVAETLWAASLEPSFGEAVARGYLDLALNAGDETTAEYRRRVRSAGQRGPVFGRLMARHLAPVLRGGSRRLAAAFEATVDVMLAKGVYTLPDPLEALSALLAGGEDAAAGVYLDLLRDAFSHDLSYVRSQSFAGLLPRAVLSFPASERVWQTVQLSRVARADPHLVDPFLEGMEAGLYLLSKESLAAFVSQALEILPGNRKQAAGLLALSSQAGMDALRRLQVTVSLGEVGPQLNRYLQARIGAGVSVQPLTTLGAAWRQGIGAGQMVVSDGRALYLPDRIGTFASRAGNICLYKALTRFEAGHLEFGTFDFDLEKMADGAPPEPCPAPRAEDCDLERFFGAFSSPRLAEDLFTAFEHGRIRKCMARRYPGLIRRCLPLLQSGADPGSGPLQLLYRLTALGMAPGEPVLPADVASAVAAVGRRFEARVGPESSVETCGRLVCDLYPEMARLCASCGGHRRLTTPFGRRFSPGLVFSRQRDHHRRAWNITSWIAARGYRVYVSDVRRRLAAGDGKLSTEDIRRMIRSGPSAAGLAPGKAPGGRERQGLDLSGLALDAASVGIQIVDDGTPEDALGYPVFRYDEWDSGMADYLKEHVRVCQRPVPELGNDFYRQTLERHGGLVKRMRRAFELLKPRSVQILRRWVEGDEFDYRALLDAAIDRRAGRIPSDRLYNKRVKQQRDVSALLLVDLSRSTANRVKGSRAAVLDVEKEAIVLFCEALRVVGDTFAIAGFSGTGRFGVDYYTVKRFEEPLGDAVRGRISGLSPQRSTRMGAAIRHATTRLQGSPSRVRLLILLGDGFPNDVDYKHGYAVADTRRAVFEAASKGVFTHAITINIAGDPRLDDLYGHVRHTVISDVRELPDKLLRIYGALTRY